MNKVTINLNITDELLQDLAKLVFFVDNRLQQGGISNAVMEDVGQLVDDVLASNGLSAQAEALPSFREVFVWRAVEAIHRNELARSVAEQTSPENIVHDILSRVMNNNNNEGENC